MNVASYYFLTLDIETSTYTEKENGKDIPKAVWLSYGYCNLYDYKGNRIRAGYYRTWEDCRQILLHYQRMFTGNILLCFVHNLGYEFDFILKNLSRPTKILSNSSHKVICAKFEAFKYIEFRCTLMLSMHTLRYIGEQLGFSKLTSEYRYILPSDEVTEEEKEYCCRDCDVTAKYVASLVEEFGVLREIPYTKTGRVRKTFNKFYLEDSGEKNWDLLPKEECYSAMLNAFAGGCVFSNPYFTGKVLNRVHSYDITSSYPFVMLTEQYPFTIEKIDKPTKSMLKNSFWIAKLKFYDIYSKFPWNWLSISKMNDYDVTSCQYFNGKLMGGNWIIRTITNVDYEMICKTYDFSKVEIIDFYDCKNYSSLPYPYIETIKIYAEKKSKLKDLVKETAKDNPNYIKINAEYALAKNDFNSIYGMSVQKLMQEEFVIDELYQWHLKEKKYKYSDKHMKRNFLYGIYITAYARKNLLQAILENCPNTFVYCDTDSIKFIGEDKFKDTNKILPKEFSEIKSLSKLGRFDKDAEYEKFLCYGAKKYAYVEEGNIYLTVAGLPHYKAGNMQIEYNGFVKDRLENIEDFRCGLCFKDCKNGHKYITTDYTFDINDNGNVINLEAKTNSVIDYLKKNKIDTKGGVVIYSVDYLLDMTETDKRIIKDYNRGYKRWLNIIRATEYSNIKCLID